MSSSGDALWHKSRDRDGMLEAFSAKTFGQRNTAKSAAGLSL